MTTTADIINNTENIINSLPEDVPPWGKVLIQLVQTLVTEVSKLNTLSALRDKVEVQKHVNKALCADNEMLRSRLNKLEQRTDTHEQHGRNRNLLLKGIDEERREDTTAKFVDTVNAHLTTKIQHADIERCHRLGAFKEGKRRPIIARFRDETKKIAVFKAKKDFKGKGFSLAENLTEMREKLYKKACEAIDYKKVWTWEGRVFAEVEGERIHIKSVEDIPGLDNPAPKPAVTPFLAGFEDEEL